MDNLFRPRNVLRGALAGALTFALLGGVIGLAGAAVEGEPEMPDSFVLAPRAIGDAATYMYANSTIKAPVDFTWSAQALVRDGYGDLRSGVRMDPLGVTFEDPLAAGGLWHGIDGSIFAAGSQRVEEFALVYPSPLNPVVTSETREVLDARTYWLFRLAPESCLAVNAIQGHDVELGGMIDVFAGCSLPDSGEVWDTPAHAVAVEATPHGNALHFVSHQGEQRLDAWFVPHIPYPVKLTMVDEASRTYTLQEFQRGSQAWPDADPAPDGVDIGFIQGAPWGFELPDHPFPPKAAYEVALNDPTWTVLSEWAARYPDHVAVEGQYEQDQMLGNREHFWSLTLRAPGAEFHLQVARTEWGGAELEAHDAGSSPVVTYRLEGEGDGRDRAFATMFPDLGDVTARMDQYRTVNTSAPVSGWRSYVQCLDVACQDLSHEYRVEVHRADWGGLAQGNTITGDFDEELQSGLVYLDDTGKFLTLHEEVAEQRSERRIVGDSATTGNQGGVPPASPPLSASAGNGIWEAPPAAAAAGMGFAAILTGVVVWLWPAIKGLPIFGLFSRVRRPQLLGNPQRRQLLAAIEDEPGIHFQGLIRKLELSNGSAVHHLRKLVEGGVVTEQVGKGYTCYFATGKVDRAVMDAAPAVRSATARKILAAVERVPGRSSKDIAAEVGLSAATLNYHVRRLSEAGLIDAARSQRALSLHVTGTGRQALAIAA